MNREICEIHENDQLIIAFLFCDLCVLLRLLILLFGSRLFAAALDAPVAFAILQPLNKARLIKRIVFIVVVANLALAAFVFLNGGFGENHYQDFVKAGGMIQYPDPGPDLEQAARLHGHDYLVPTSGFFVDVHAEEWLEIVSSNGPALTAVQNQLQRFLSQIDAAFKLAQAALAGRCRMPRDHAFSGQKQVRDDLPAIKKLVLAFWECGNEAMVAGLTNESVERYLESVEISEKSTRGGTTVTKMAGLENSGFGINGLWHWVNSVDAAESRKVVARLQALEDQDDSVDEVMHAEENRDSWEWTLSPKRMHEQWEEQVRIREDRKFNPLKIQMDNFRQAATQFLGEDRVARRRLMVAFAARAYELEKGKRPKTLKDLVPNYLKAVPQDKVDGKNVVYKF